jgi:hypothetical protein
MTKIIVKQYNGGDIYQIISETEGWTYIKANTEKLKDMVHELAFKGECSIEEFNAIGLVWDIINEH